MSVKKPKDRLELDHRLRSVGRDGALYPNDRVREAHRWLLKQRRQGNYDKTIRAAELR